MPYFIIYLCRLFDKKHYDICMKKFLLLIVCSLLVSPTFAADTDFDTDLWSNYNNEEIINNAKEPQFITDEDFEDAIQKIDSKVNKWK